MVSLQDLWSVVIEELKKEVPYIALQTWFDDIEVVALQDRALLLYSPVTFKRETIQRYYSDRLGKVLRDIMSQTIEIRLLSPEAYQEQCRQATGRPRSLRDSGAYTFERLVVGPSNQLAVAAARAAADGRSGYSGPLVIYGASGLGKTHLLNAIATEVTKQRPNANVVCVKGEEFTHELIEAITQDRKTEFRTKYRGAEYFLMDDIQFIAGKKQTQEEFFNTFDHLYEANCQIVLTLDRPPRELSTLQERIRNRFEGGLMVEIEPPDLDMRRAILRSKAEQRGLSLTEGEIEQIARQVVGDVRKLEGVLNKVNAIRSLPGCSAGSADVVAAIRSYRSDEGDRVAPQDVIGAVAEKMHVEEEQMMGRSRAGAVTQARQIAMYLLCQVHGASTTEVGRIFGRDHSTVIHAIGRIRERAAADPAIQGVIRALSEG